MSNPLLTVSLKCYEPKTYGNNDVERKKELRDLILQILPMFHTIVAIPFHPMQEQGNCLNLPVFV